MSPAETELRGRIVDAGRLMYANRWVASNDGNLSVRLSEDRILITPTGMSKGAMRCDDLVVVNGEGGKLEGSRQPTSEIAMHLAIYAARPDVHALCMRILRLPRALRLPGERSIWRCCPRRL